MNKITITSILLIIVIAIAAFSYSNEKSVAVAEKTIIGDTTDTLKQLIDLNFINFDLGKVKKIYFLISEEGITEQLQKVDYQSLN